MNYEFQIGDCVSINKQACIDNGASLYVDFTDLFTVTNQLDIGEPAYHIRSTKSNDKVLLSEDIEYAFIDEELIMVCPYSVLEAE